MAKDEIKKNKLARTDRPITIYDPFKKYINEIKSIPVLTREEEKKLAFKYLKNGDDEAAYTLIVSNLRLVVKIAMEFHRKWIKNASDLVQEGNIGLMEALKRYDPYKGVRFSSYASYWIRAYVIKFIMDNYSLIKIGKTQTQRKLFFNLKKERKKLEQLGYEVGPKLLAEKLEVRERDVIEMQQRMNSDVISYDEPLGGDSSQTHLDMMPHGGEAIDDTLAKKQVKDILTDAFARFKEGLNEKERYIFEKRILSEDPMNLREIGEELGFSRERARQIESKVIKKLKAFLQENLPEIDLHL